MAMCEGLEIWKKKNAEGEVPPGKKGMKNLKLKSYNK